MVEFFKGAVHIFVNVVSAIIVLIIIFSLGYVIPDCVRNITDKCRIKKAIKDKEVMKKFRCCNYCKRKIILDYKKYCEKYGVELNPEKVSISNDCVSYKGNRYNIINDYSLEYEFEVIEYEDK